MCKFSWTLKSEFPDLTIKRFGEDPFGESSALCHILVKSETHPRYSLKIFRKLIDDTNKNLYDIKKSESLAGIPVSIENIKRFYQNVTSEKYDQASHPAVAFDKALSLLYKLSSDDVFETMSTCMRICTSVPVDGGLGYRMGDNQPYGFNKILEGLGLSELNTTSREILRNFDIDCRRIDAEWSKYIK